MREARGPEGASSPRPRPRPAPAPQFGNRHLHPPPQRQYASRLPPPPQRPPGADTLIAAAAPGPRPLPGSSLLSDRRVKRAAREAAGADSDSCTAMMAAAASQRGVSGVTSLNTWRRRKQKRC